MGNREGFWLGQDHAASGYQGMGAQIWLGWAAPHRFKTPVFLPILFRTSFRSLSMNAMKLHRARLRIYSEEMSAAFP